MVGSLQPSVLPVLRYLGSFSKLLGYHGWYTKTLAGKTFMFIKSKNKTKQNTQTTTTTKREIRKDEKTGCKPMGLASKRN